MRIVCSDQKQFVFTLSESCSQIFTPSLYLWPKFGLTYVISIVKFLLFSFCLLFFFSFLIFT